MKFYSRQKEIEELELLLSQTNNSSRMSVLTGRRRIGKTMLSLEFVKNKKFIYYLTLIPLFVIIIIFAWLFTIIFEGEKPSVTLNPLAEYLSKKQEFQLNVRDMKSGIRKINVTYSQGNNDIAILDEKFSYSSIFCITGHYRFNNLNYFRRNL